MMRVTMASGDWKETVVLDVATMGEAVRQYPHLFVWSCYPVEV